MNAFRTKRLFFSLIIACGMISVVACSDGDDNTPNSQQNTPSTLPAGTFVSWTEGSNPYAGYIPSEGDQITIELVKEGLCNIKYVSEQHGTGTLTGVSITKTDSRYLFSKPITVQFSEDKTDFVFSQEPDRVTMPNRNPNGGEVTYKDYPFVLNSGWLSVDGKQWQFDMTAYCNVRYLHRVIVREGAIGNRKGEE